MMRIRSVDMGSETSVELVHEPSDRAARWPLSVRPAIAGRDLNRHDREAPLRLIRQRCRGNGIRTVEVPIRVRQESASMRGRGKAPSGASSFKARQLLQAEFQCGKLVEMAVHGRDEVDEAQGCEGSALPLIVNTRRASTCAKVKSSAASRRAKV